MKTKYICLFILLMMASYTLSFGQKKGSTQWELKEQFRDSVRAFIDVSDLVINNDRRRSPELSNLNAYLSYFDLDLEDSLSQCFSRVIDFTNPIILNRINQSSKGQPNYIELYEQLSKIQDISVTPFQYLDSYYVMDDNGQNYSMKRSSIIKIDQQIEPSDKHSRITKNRFQREVDFRIQYEGKTKEIKDGKLVASGSDDKLLLDLRCYISYNYKKKLGITSRIIIDSVGLRPPAGVIVDHPPFDIRVGISGFQGVGNHPNGFFSSDIESMSTSGFVNGGNFKLSMTRFSIDKESGKLWLYSGLGIKSFTSKLSMTDFEFQKEYAGKDVEFYENQSNGYELQSLILFSQVSNLSQTCKTIFMSIPLGIQFEKPIHRKSPIQFFGSVGIDVLIPIQESASLDDGIIKYTGEAIYMNNHNQDMVNVVLDDPAISMDIIHFGQESNLSLSDDISYISRPGFFLNAEIGLTIMNRYRTIGIRPTIGIINQLSQFPIDQVEVQDLFNAYETRNLFSTMKNLNYNSLFFNIEFVYELSRF